MQNILFGSVTILICLSLYFFAYKNFKQEKYGLSILFIVISGCLLYFFSASDFFLHAWDERYHALVAKNLINHPLLPTLYDRPILDYDYRMWVGNHIWVHKQPLPLWLMAASLKIVGINEIALRLPSILFSSIGIFLTYRIADFFYDKKVGLFAAFLFSINGLIIELTAGRVATDHVDVIFLFFILLAIYLITVFVAKKKVIYTLLIGVCVGAAILTKWLPALIVLPIWLLILIDSKAFSLKAILFHGAVLSSTIVLIALPWQLYIYSAFPLEAAHEASFNWRHFTEVLDEQGGSPLYFLNRIRINYGELIYLPLIWFFWKLYKDPKDLKKLALVIWFLVPIVFFSIAKTKMQGYILFTSPALFIITAAFFFQILQYKKQGEKKWLANIGLLVFIVLPFRYGIERMKPFENRDRNPQWTVDLKELHKENIENGILFNYERPIEAMFYTDLVVYDKLPSLEKLFELKKEGHQILINDHGNLGDLEDYESFKIIQLSSPE